MQTRCVLLSHAHVVEWGCDWHVTGVLHSCNYHMHTLRHIRPLLTLNAAKMITHSVVSSRLDYANTLLHQPQQAASGTEHTGQGDVSRYTDNYTGCQYANE